MKREDKLNNRKESDHVLAWIIFAEVVVVLVGLMVIVYFYDDERDPLAEQEITIQYYEETEAVQTETVAVNPVPAPDIDEQYLTINEWSRPGEMIESLDYIVIHYLGNPMTSAQQNHDYFESLKDLQDDYMSANYIVGINGEIIHCIPDDEVAYASNSANNYSISIENCHLDDSGEFTEETYTSLVHLVAYLSEEYGISRDHIIRHYDVTGKECPRYYVDHEDAWEKFRDDVMEYRRSCARQAEEETAGENAS